MSNTKQRRRRQKATNFLDSEEIQNVQINQETQKHKFQEKTQNMFDAHLLEPNHFLKKEKEQMESGVINLDQTQEATKQQEQTNQQTTQDNKTKKKTKRKRVKKQIFDSEEDEQEDQAKQVISNKKEKIYLKQDNTQKLEEMNVISQQSQGQGNQKEDDEFNDIEDKEFNDIVQKKSQPSEVIVHLHIQLNKLSKQDRKYFYYQPLRKGQSSFCYFKRYASGISDYFQLTGQDHRPLLYCQNQRGCIGCNYYISLTKEMDKSKPSYLGKLRGNASGSTYILYDGGAQPSKSIDRAEWRVSMGCIEYQTNFMGMKGPRKLKAILPRANSLEDFDMFKLSQQQSLNNFKPPVVKQFRNKTPKWNQKLKSYALNFGGKVKMASIKNFILIDDSFAINDEEDSQNMMIFGKMDENTFSLQFRHPLSLYQAFGIAMSQFDFKLNCE